MEEAVSASQTDLSESNEPSSPSSGPTPELGASICPSEDPYLSGTPLQAMNDPMTSRAASMIASNSTMAGA